MNAIDLLCTIDVGQLDECWPWRGSKNGSGYGNVRYPTGLAVPTSAHRAAFMAFRGPIPPGHDVHHACFTRKCCNWVRRLQVVPARVNRGTTRRWSDISPHAAKRAA